MLLTEIGLTATYPFEAKRYHFGPVSNCELALALKPGAYLSHGTAAQLYKHRREVLSDQRANALSTR